MNYKGSYAELKRYILNFIRNNETFSLPRNDSNYEKYLVNGVLNILKSDVKFTNKFAELVLKGKYDRELSQILNDFMTLELNDKKDVNNDRVIHEISVLFINNCFEKGIQRNLAGLVSYYVKQIIAELLNMGYTLKYLSYYFGKPRKESNDRVEKELNIKTFGGTIDNINRVISAYIELSIVEKDNSYIDAIKKYVSSLNLNLTEVEYTNLISFLYSSFDNINVLDILLGKYDDEIVSFIYDERKRINMSVKDSKKHSIFDKISCAFNNKKFVQRIAEITLICVITTGTYSIFRSIKNIKSANLSKNLYAHFDILSPEEYPIISVSSGRSINPIIEDTMKLCHQLTDEGNTDYIPFAFELATRHIENPSCGDIELLYGVLSEKSLKDGINEFSSTTALSYMAKILLDNGKITDDEYSDAIKLSIKFETYFACLPEEMDANFGWVTSSEMQKYLSIKDKYSILAKDCEKAYIAKLTDTNTKVRKK